MALESSDLKLQLLLPCLLNCRELISNDSNANLNNFGVNAMQNYFKALKH